MISKGNSWNWQPVYRPTAVFSHDPITMGGILDTHIYSALSTVSRSSKVILRSLKVISRSFCIYDYHMTITTDFKPQKSQLQQKPTMSHFLPQENVFLTRQGRASTVKNIFLREEM